MCVLQWRTHSINQCLSFNYKQSGRRQQRNGWGWQWWGRVGWGSSWNIQSRAGQMGIVHSSCTSICSKEEFVAREIDGPDEYAWVCLCLMTVLWLECRRLTARVCAMRWTNTLFSCLTSWSLFDSLPSFIILTLLQSQTIFKYPLDVDEAALCSVACRFWEFDSPCLVVGTTYNMMLRPRSAPKSTIKVFAYNSDYKLHLIHSVRERWKYCGSSNILWDDRKSERISHSVCIRPECRDAACVCVYQPCLVVAVECH